MELLGYLGALVIGVLLGLMGGGGSIMAVPIFVYILGLSPVLATAYSLFVVGATSGIGAIRNHLLGQIDVKTGVIFAIPSFIAVYLTRKFLVPAIPDEIFNVGNWSLTKDMSIMIFFGIIMLMASFNMIRSRKKTEGQSDEKSPHYNYPLILLEGALVGVLTGIVGAGGGFLIIPVLVLMVGLPMKKAVGTSLMIISVKSLIGFLGDVQNLEMDWGFLLSFTLLSVIGIIIGIQLGKRISNQSLKKGFGYFVLLMAIFILTKEILGV